ncbi:MAG: hypothetical protein JRF61_00720 [Deltaproteobacteria bacterium]|jgi:hypothetical protein|nr:hypothetical protein [Deltaproteobacteria bacterium]
MARTAIGIAIGALFVAAVIWGALAGSSVECEICVDYKGRHACSVAAAADQAQALAQAQSGACAQVAGGVTETLECSALRPSQQRCTP